MLLERWYENVSSFVGRFQSFFSQFPEMQHLHTAAQQLAQTQGADPSDPAFWHLADLLFPSFTKCEEAFREKNVLVVLQQCDLAKHCHLLEIWSLLAENDRKTAFGTLCQIATFAQFLAGARQARPLKTGPNTCVNEQMVLYGRYAVADHVCNLLDGKLRHAGYDVAMLLTDPSQLGMGFFDLINELTMDKAFEVQIMTLLEKEFGWDLVRKSLHVFALPPPIYALVDRFLQDGGGDENAAVDSKDTATDAKENFLESKSSEKESDAMVDIMDCVSKAKTNPPKSLSIEALIPKDMNDWSQMITTMAPLLTDAKSREAINAKKMADADALAFAASCQSRLAGTPATGPCHTPHPQPPPPPQNARHLTPQHTQQNTPLFSSQQPAFQNPGPSNVQNPLSTNPASTADIHAFYASQMQQQQQQMQQQLAQMQQMQAQMTLMQQQMLSQSVPSVPHLSRAAAAEQPSFVRQPFHQPFAPGPQSQPFAPASQSQPFAPASQSQPFAPASQVQAFATGGKAPTSAPTETHRQVNNQQNPEAQMMSMMAGMSTGGDMSRDINKLMSQLGLDFGALEAAAQAKPSATQNAKRKVPRVKSKVVRQEGTSAKSEFSESEGKRLARSKPTSDNKPPSEVHPKIKVSKGEHTAVQPKAHNKSKPSKSACPSKAPLHSGGEDSQTNVAVSQ